jgi:hypothetical protein
MSKLLTFDIYLSVRDELLISTSVSAVKFLEQK